MKKKKYIYFIWLYNRKAVSYGMQPVKADTQKEARRKFKKRFKNRTIVDIERQKGEINHFTLSHAI